MKNRRCFFIICLCLIALVFGAQAWAETHVSENISVDTTWTLLESPYIMDNAITVQNPSEQMTLTIEAGVEVRFTDSAQNLTLGTGAVLDVQGTEEDPVLLTTEESDKTLTGQWGGVLFQAGSNASDSTITCAIFECGGSASSPSGAMLYIDTGSPVITSSTFRYSLNHGIYITANADPQIASCAFADNTQTGITINRGTATVSSCRFDHNGRAMDLMDTLPSFDGNTADDTQVIQFVYDINIGNIISKTGTLEYPGALDSGKAIPYTNNFIHGWSISNDTQDITLTIEAGVEIGLINLSSFWAQNFTIANNAALVVQGTEANPVLFTTRNLDVPQAGQWGEVILRWDCRATASRIEGAVFEYGGNMLHIYTGSPIIKSSTFRHGSGAGILIEGGGSPHITDCTMTNSYAGILFNGTSSHSRIEKNYFSNNGWSILKYSSVVCLIARNNDWGEPTGPYDHIDDTSEACGFYNPGGKGTQIAQEVNYTSWIGGAQIFIDAPMRSGQILEGDSLRFLGRLVNAGNPTLRWDLGDGRTAGVQDPGVVTFSTTGAKEISFAMLDGEGGILDSPDTRAFTVVEDTGPIPDLAVTGFQLPEDLALGKAIQITYRVTNEGDGAVPGASWFDALYVSSDPYLDGRDTLLERVLVSEDLASQEFYEGALDATIDADAVGAFYLILSVDDQWEVLERHQLNNEASEEMDITVPELSDGEAVSGSFSPESRVYYYQAEVPAGKNLKVTLDDGDDQGENRLYLRHGFAPTLSAYDHRSTEEGADQQVLVPAATGGTWYIMVYVADPGPGSSGDFSIRIDLSDSELFSVTPTEHGNSTDMVLTLKGAGFFAGAEVRLESGGSSYEAGQAEVDSLTQITATFAARAVPPGTYTVQVTLPGVDPMELADAFTVIAGGEAKLEVKGVVPNQVGYHALATIYVEYANTGEVAMPAPLLSITAIQKGKQHALLTLDQSRLKAGFWTSAVPEGFSSAVQILGSGETAGILQPGESMRIPVYYAGWQQPWDPDYAPIEFTFSALTSESTEPFDPSEMKGAIKPAHIDAEAWEAIFANFASEVGTTWGGFLAMLNENAGYLGRFGQNIRDVNALISFQLKLADGLGLVAAQTGAVDTIDTGTIMAPSFARFYKNTISDRYRIGPFGRGWTHSWETSLAVASDGTVTIDVAGIQQIFQPDRRGGYFSQTEDNTSLTKSGNVFTLTESDGFAYVFRDGRLDYAEDTNGNRINTAYSNNLLTGLSNTSGSSLTIAYNAAGRIERLTDSLGNETSYTYDGTNEHLLTVNHHDGKQTTYAYSIDQGAAMRHAITQIEYPDGRHDYFSFDSKGRLSGNHGDNNHQPVAFTYGPGGKISISNAIGATSQFFLDQQSLIAKEVDALGNISWTSFSKDLNVQKDTASTGQSKIYLYDNRANLISITDPLGDTLSFKYNPQNSLSSLMDMNQNTTEFRYDTRQNLTLTTHADSSEEGFTYDARGRTTRYTNRRKNAVDYTYNNSDQVEEAAYGDGSKVSYTYDSRGRTVSAQNDAGTTTLEYVNDVDLKKITYPGGRSLECTYDSAGRRASIEDHSGNRTNYHYDGFGNLQRLTDKAGNTIVEYQYDALDRLTRRELGNGVYTTYEYDILDRIIHLINRDFGDTVISRFDYTYDALGQRVSMVTLDGEWSYGYDAVGQLTSAVFESDNPGIPDQDLSYAYDAMGNRTRTVINNTTTDYTANNMNQYTMAGSDTYEHDDDGNRVVKKDTITWDYSYDSANRLVGMTNGADVWSYVYDAFGNRVASIKNGTKTEFVIDPVGLSKFVAEYDQTGTLIARYEYGLGLLSRNSASGSTAFYTYDALGNTSELTDSSGTVLNRYRYLPFGERLSVTEAIGNRFQFGGEDGVMHEGGDLYVMRARFYDPALGRFFQPDPIGILGGFNLYAYTGNSPINYSDPTGLTMHIPSGPMWEAFMMGIMEVGARARGGIFNPGGKNLRPAWWEKWAKHLSKKEIAEYSKQLPKGKRLTQKIKIGRLARLARYLNGIPKGSPAYVGYIAAAFAVGYAGGYVWQKSFSNETNEAIQETIAQIIYPVVRLWTWVTRPKDPNQKLGPGYGEAGYVQAGSTLPYRIDFENDPTATAPAQVVTVTDQLSSDLDWSTFELTEVGFGDYLIPVPAKTQAFDHVEPMTYNGKDIEVHIRIRLDQQTGKLDVLFASIDPESGLPPTVDIGFLPPEDDTGRGQGYFSYLIKPKAGLSTGTEIRNVAVIRFDFGEVIATNQVDPHDPSAGTDPNKEALVTIDADLPDSSVTAFPDTSPLTFEVEWSGEDVGSGVGTYTIYVQDNGSGFKPWLTNTEETSTMFTGEAGHTYGFYSIVTDNAGNTETAKTVAEATTLAQDMVSIGLDSGWNLISFYRHPGNTSISTVLASISDEVVSVWAFKGNDWKIYDPDNPGVGGLTTMEAGWAYWINMSDAGTLEFTSSAPNNTISLSSGWNLVGYNASSSQAVTDAVDSIDGKYSLIWAYKDDNWRLYDAVIPGFSDLSVMEPGYGYWIKATQGCTWTLP